MDRKNPFKRRKTQMFSVPPADPPTAPPPANSERAHSFSPISSFSKVVTLSDWWLIKSGTDAGGKTLAVEGFSAQEMFTSAPIVERYDSFTVKTADGIIVMFQGPINKSRTHQNGFPLKVSRCFLFGFPSSWDSYPDGDFWKEPTCPMQQSGSSSAAKQCEHLSNATGKPTGIGSASTALSDPVDIRSGVANAGLPFETLGRYEVDKSDQNRGKRMGCADRIIHGAKENDTGHATKASCSENRMHYAGLGTMSDVDDRVIMCYTNPLPDKHNCTGNHEMGQDMQSEKGTEFKRDNNFDRSPAGKLDPVAHLPNVKEDKSNDETAATTIDSVVEGALNDLSRKEHFQQCNQSENHAGRFQNDAEKTRDRGAVIFEDFPPRTTSVGMHSNSLAATMNLPLEVSFESPPSGAQRNVDNTPTSVGLAEKGCSSLSRVLCSQLWNRFSDYVRRSGNHAQRIRLDHTSDSETRRDSNRNEAGSLTVDPCTVLETVLKSSKSDKDGKLNNPCTITSTDSRVKKVLNSWRPTERKGTHEKLERRQHPYTLRSRTRVGETVNDMCLLDDLSVRRNSKQADANSSAVEMNVPSDPSHQQDARRSSKAPKKKREGKGHPAIKGRLDGENECRNITVEHNYTNVSRGVNHHEHIHDQSPLMVGFLSGTYVSSLEESSSKFQHNPQLCSTSTSPDAINKKRVDHSEHGKAGDITRKSVPELPNNQDPEALTEAPHSKTKTLNMYKRKTIRRPCYSQDGTITGIANVNDLDASCKGVKSKRQRKRKRRQ